MLLQIGCGSSLPKVVAKFAAAVVVANVCCFEWGVAAALVEVAAAAVAVLAAAAVVVVVAAALVVVAAAAL